MSEYIESETYLDQLGITNEYGHLVMAWYAELFWSGEWIPVLASNVLGLWLVEGRSDWMTTEQYALFAPDWEKPIVLRRMGEDEARNTLVRQTRAFSSLRIFDQDTPEFDELTRRVRMLRGAS